MSLFAAEVQFVYIDSLQKKSIQEYPNLTNRYLKSLIFESSPILMCQGYLRVLVIRARLKPVLIYGHCCLRTVGVVTLRLRQGSHQRVFTWDHRGPLISSTTLIDSYHQGNNSDEYYCVLQESCFSQNNMYSDINTPPLLIKKVLEALLSRAFSSRLRSLSGGSLSHRLLCLLPSGSSDTPGKTGRISRLLIPHQTS